MIYTIAWPWLLAGAILIGLVVAGIVALFTYEDAGLMFGAVTFVLVAAMAFTIPMTMRESRAYETWCQAQGGHTDSTTQTTTVPVVNANGSVGVGTSSSTTTFCLTADGRIIDVQG